MVFIFVLLQISFPPLSLAEKMTDHWKLTGFTKYRDAVFADMTRLGSPTPDTVSVWIKIAPSKRSKYLQAVWAYLASVHKDHQRFRSVEILCEIDCTGYRIRMTKFVYLDDARTVIHETPETQRTWIPIHHGGIWHPVAKTACSGKS